MPNTDVFPILVTFLTCLWLGACPEESPEQIGDAVAAESALDAAEPEEPAAAEKRDKTKKPDAMVNDAGAPGSATRKDAKDTRDEDAGTERPPSGSTPTTSTPAAAEKETVMMQCRWLRGSA